MSQGWARVTIRPIRTLSSFLAQSTSIGLDPSLSARVVGFSRDPSKGWREKNRLNTATSVAFLDSDVWNYSHTILSQKRWRIPPGCAFSNVSNPNHQLALTGSMPAGCLRALGGCHVLQPELREHMACLTLQVACQTKRTCAED